MTHRLGLATLLLALQRGPRFGEIVVRQNEVRIAWYLRATHKDGYLCATLEFLQDFIHVLRDFIAGDFEGDAHAAASLSCAVGVARKSSKV
jgi:hypothetical protein